METTPTGARIVSSTGERMRLVHGPDDAALDALDGYRVVLEGNRLFGALRVTTWEVPEGLHGMAVWIGRLERRGMQLGLLDHDSGAFYLLDEEAWRELDLAVGQLVLVEGYIDGPHRVRVLHHQVLDAG